MCHLPCCYSWCWYHTAYGVWGMANGDRRMERWMDGWLATWMDGWVVHTFYSQQQSHKPHNQALVSVFMSIWILHAAAKLDGADVSFVGIVLGGREEAVNRKLAQTALHIATLCAAFGFRIEGGVALVGTETDFLCAPCLVCVSCLSFRQPRLGFYSRRCPCICSTGNFKLNVQPSVYLLFLLLSLCLLSFQAVSCFSSDFLSALPLGLICWCSLGVGGPRKKL